MPQFVGTRKLSIRVLLNEKRNGNRDAISRLSDEAPTISLGLFPSRFARREVIKQNIECLIVLVDERVPSGKGISTGLKCPETWDQRKAHLVATISTLCGLIRLTRSRHSKFMVK
uniref:Uncharacterized protein n=1 Tax=Vespula pensylvanica TaxID=30213 RepID=A0A834PCT7_VESPE|nr:hypothetical protein H0235_003764 [Vespula pensylvanica]